MLNTDLLNEITKELKAHKKKAPNWPKHGVAQAAILSENTGKLMEAAIKLKYYNPGVIDKAAKKDLIKKLAAQNIALTIRFLENFK